MSTVSWITPRGNLGTIPENIFYSYQFEASDSDQQELFYSFISGSLPGGMYVTRTGELRGIPTILSSVNQTATSTFTVRATNPEGKVADRSFYLSINNINGPQILPRPDLIGAWFDGNLLDYTFASVNDNPNAIQTWSIIQGTIPPGTTFTSEGRLFGYVDLIAANTTELGFEAAPNDAIVFDALPKSTDRFYNFTVQVTDDLKIDTINVRVLIVSKGNYTADNDVTSINNTFIKVDSDNKYRPIIINEIESLPILVAGSTFAYRFIAYDPEDKDVSWKIDEIEFSGMDDVDAALNQTLTGTLGAGPYTMIQVPTSAARITVAINDILLTAATHYTTVGNQLTISSTPLALLSATSAFNVATITFATQPAAPFPRGAKVTILGVTGETSYNGTFTVLDCTVDSLTYSLTTALPGTIFGSTVRLAAPTAFDTIFVQYISITTGYDTLLFDQGASGLPGRLIINADTGWVIGTLPSQVEDFKSYTFTVFAFRTLFPLEASNPTRFTITTKRTLNEEIVWTTPFNLGSIENGAVSEIEVDAYNTLGKPLVYELVYAPFRKIPQGLRFLRSGRLIGRTTFRYFALDGQVAWLNITSTEGLEVGMTIQGVGVAAGCKLKVIVDDNTIEVSPAIYVSQGTILVFSNDTVQKAVSTISNAISTVIDGTRTTFDQQCGFTVRATSIDGSITSLNSFTVKVRPRNLSPYENVYLKALPSYTQRLSWEVASKNETIFPPELIYRPDDSYFGIQRSLKSLFLAGLNPNTAQNFVSAIERNHYLKSINFGEIKTARAVNSDGTVGYELIYVDLIDNQSYDTPGPPLEVQLSIANSFLFNDQSYNVIYPNSFPNMQKRLENGIGYSNKSTLPRWMSSVQEDGRVLGLIRCVILAYTIPGASKLIAYRLQNSGFDINTIPFTADRYQWDNYLSKYYNTTTNTFDPSIPTTFDKFPSIQSGTSILDITLVNQVINSNIIEISDTINVGYGWIVSSRDADITIPDGTRIENLNQSGNLLTITNQITAPANGAIRINGEATVDYAVSTPFNSLDGESLSVVITDLLIDGVPNFERDDKIIFAKQFGYGGVNDGWIDVQGNTIPGYLEKITGAAIINKRAGVWSINWTDFPELGLDDDLVGFDEISEELNYSHFDQGNDAELSLIFEQEIIFDQTVKVKTGDTFKTTTLQYNTVAGEAVPSYYLFEFATGFERIAETTFDGGTCIMREGFKTGSSFAGGTRFSSNQDKWIIPESEDKYIKFPQNGVFV
jgi:hypothetical protein